MIKSIKRDILVLAVIFFSAFLFWLFPRLFRSDEAQYIRIVQDGKEIGQYQLFEDQTVVITDKDGGYNLLLISGGRADMTDADCPDQLCVKRQAVSQNGESIICLPHRLVIEIIAKEETALDGVVY